MLPDRDEGSDTVLAIVEQYDPGELVSNCVVVRLRMLDHSHSVLIHRLADEELVVAEVANNLLRETRRTLLELLDLVLARTVGLHLLLDSLHVALQMAEVALLVELRLLHAERVDDVDLGLLLLVATLILTTLS